MPDLLNLASDFFEYMANPAHGTAVNEEYALRLAAILNDERTAGFLVEEASRLSDPDTLTAHGWLWFLDYARARDLRMPGELLLQLAERWSSVPMLVTVIEVATRDDERANGWLDTLIERTTSVPVRSVDGIPEGDVFVSAESLLVALLQVGDQPAIGAASRLLHRRWRGQERLVELFWALTDELEGGVREVWISRLEPPRRRDPHDER